MGQILFFFLKCSIVFETCIVCVHILTAEMYFLSQQRTVHHEKSLLRGDEDQPFENGLIYSFYYIKLAFHRVEEKQGAFFFPENLPESLMEIRGQD